MRASRLKARILRRLERGQETSLAWNKEETERLTGGPGNAAAPDESRTGPLFDPLDSTTPPAVDRPQPPRGPERPVRTDVIPRGNVRPKRDEQAAPRRRRSRPAARRVKRTVRHIDPLSVLKLSLIYYACFLVLWLLFVAAIYSLLMNMGVFDAIESFARGSVLLEKGEELGISLWVVERWAFLVGLTLGVIAALVNAFLSFLYNLAADLVGGVELTFLERDL